jgi:uncharacterized sporulation protein YeaH/YhbH (DUF444 family)
VSLLKRLLGRQDDATAPARPAAAAYDPSAAEASYERLLAAAMLLRNLDADLARTAEGLAEREARLRASAEEYDRLSQAAIAGGRTIQAESAIASAETAQAALDALAPRVAEVAALRTEAASVASRIEGEAAALRSRLDSRVPLGDPSAAVARAEDDAVRLTSVARSLSF